MIGRNVKQKRFADYYIETGNAKASYFRTTADGINTIKGLFDKGIKVHVLNMGIIEDTPTGRLILSVMFAFAEFERDLILERIQEGKAIAKQRDDFREGRPKKYGKKQIEHALKLLETHSYKQVEETTGISKIEKKGLGGKKVNRVGLSLSNQYISKLRKLATACNMRYTTLAGMLVEMSLDNLQLVNDLQKEYCTQRAYKVIFVRDSQGNGEIQYVLAGREDL